MNWKEADAAVRLEKVLQRARRIVPGDPLDERTTFASLANAGQRERVKDYINRGIQEGAEAVLRGSVQETGSCFVSPTVFDWVEPKMSVAREEIFGRC